MEQQIEPQVGWRVTGTALQGEQSKVGGGCNLSSESDIGDQNRAFWRVLDDDRNEYFRGVIWGDHCTLEPLDEWACENYGATTIEYRNNGIGYWKPVN